MANNEGRRLRDEALDAMESKNAEWLKGVMAFAKAKPIGERFKVEDIRLAYPIKPSHHNTWGSVGRALVRNGIAREVGLSAAKDKRSHARRMPDYERIAETDFN